MTTLLSISALLFTVMLMQMGTGDLGPLDTLSAIELGFSNIQIGIIGAAHFTGFIIGCFGLFLNRRNMILILMCIEIILLAANINFVSASVFLNDINGQVFSIFILTIAAAEAAIGLAILVIYFRNKGEIDVTKINQLRD